jgi:hypothetical protein
VVQDAALHRYVTLVGSPCEEEHAAEPKPFKFIVPTRTA